MSHFPSNLPKLPAKAIVVLDRVPNLYDKTQLKLEVLFISLYYNCIYWLLRTQCVL